MSKWFRWSGLGIFFGLIAVFALIWLLVLPKLILWGVEESGARFLGAKVDVASVELGFSPLEIGLYGVEVGDKDAPMFNLFEFESALAKTNWTALLLQKVIIHDLSLEGLEFGGERTYSAALEKDDASEENSEGASVKQTLEEIGAEAKGKLPSVDDILARESLLTVQYGEGLKDNIDLHKEKIEAQIQMLPDQEKLDTYKKRIAQITDRKIESLDDFTQSKAELDKIIVELKQDKTQISKTKQLIEEGYTALEQDYQALEAAPKEDLDRLVSKYSLDAGGFANFAQLVLGSESAEQVRKVFGYYEMLSPYLENSAGAAEGNKESAVQDAQNEPERLAEAGRYIHFESDKPSPDFWIQALRFGYLAAQEHTPLSVEVFDISHQQELTGKPLVLKVVSETGPALRFNGTLDRRGGASNDRFDLALASWPLTNKDFGKGLELLPSKLDLTAEAKVRDRALSATFNGKINETGFKLAQEEGEDSWKGYLREALADIETFGVSGEAEGPLGDVRLSLASDLDKQMSGAVKGQVDKQTMEWKSKLSKALYARLGNYSESYQQYASDIDTRELSLDSLSGEVSALADAKIESYEDKAKKKIQDKLGEKLKGLF